MNSVQQIRALERWLLDQVHQTEGPGSSSTESVCRNMALDLHQALIMAGGGFGSNIDLSIEFLVPDPAKREGT